MLVLSILYVINFYQAIIDSSHISLSSVVSQFSYEAETYMIRAGSADYTNGGQVRYPSHIVNVSAGMENIKHGILHLTEFIQQIP